MLAWITLGCAAVPALLYLWNSFLFREPPELPDPTPRPPPPLGEGEKETESAVLGASPNSNRASDSPSPGGGGWGVRSSPISVLIPARNEELGIEACVRSVLASQHIELEVIVLDDASTDRTAEIVRAIAAEDSRVRLETAPPLPEGWCGKQHACFSLAKLARFDTLTFLDADVRLEPNAMARMQLFLKQSGAELVSGFPRQETGTLLEKLLIPLINWVLLCFLPLWGMRHFRWAAFGAGCGQWFMTTRTAYEKVGGHAAVKSSLHDGLILPRAYRKAGFWTDLCDATNLATCRMYRSASGVWFGLAKNAREGMAATGQIGFWTVVLLCGQVLPPVLAVMAVAIPGTPNEAFIAALSAYALSIAPRAMMSHTFRHSPMGVEFYPFAILLLLAIQWYAAIRVIMGKPVGWKGRTHPK
jgi:hypothetical protein